MQKKEILIKNEKIFYIEENSGKPKVLFLHGFNSSHSFAQQVYKITDRNYDVVAFDFPGCGLSSNNGTITIEYYQQIAEEFVKETGISFNLVIGHSLGGASALHLLNNNLVPKALLAAPINYNILGTIAKETLKQSKERLNKWLLPKNYEEAYESSDNLVYENKNNYKKNLEKIANVFLTVTKNKFAVFNNLVRKQIINSSYLQKNIKNLYAINKDYEFISGTKDMFVPFISVAKIASDYNKNFIGLKNCGHALFFEKPNEINKRIEEIIKTQTN
ncbi:alpha/beta fold hydrolase [Mycoplasma sp. 5370]